MRIETSLSGSREVPRTATVSFPPKATIRCSGTLSFRSRDARDLGCLLDVDDAVERWECLPIELRVGDLTLMPDFLVTFTSGRQCLMDASDHGNEGIEEAASAAGLAYEFVTREQREQGWRLRNARDLLRYGNYRCPLGDRIRVMTALDEVGSFSIADGLALFREIAPMAGLASLAFQRIVSLELDDALIGPDTCVRRTVR